MISTIEKVLLLQKVEIFETVSTENLARIAAVTKIRDFRNGEIIYYTDEKISTMYIVLNGKVRLHRQEEEVLLATENSVFGAWSLLDEESQLVTATCIEDSSLLTLSKNDFYELLAEDTDLTKAILQFMSKRLRKLAGTVSIPPKKS